jgi:hypothetical protein
MSKLSTCLGAEGFSFERRVGYMLGLLKATFDDSWKVTIYTEQEIRDFFKEQSLNGVDHFVLLESPSSSTLFLIQEKWKLVTNQREVSQFLDCCARILARMPNYKGDIHRIWASRTVPSQNGEKSLKEGQCLIVQTCTSQSLLALNLIFMICEILQKRDAGLEIFKKIGCLLPSAEEAILDPATSFEPISDFGEKRILPITNKTVVMVNKME